MSRWKPRMSHWWRTPWEETGFYDGWPQSREQCSCWQWGRNCKNLVATLPPCCHLGQGSYQIKWYHLKILQYDDQLGSWIRAIGHYIWLTMCISCHWRTLEIVNQWCFDIIWYNSFIGANISQEWVASWRRDVCRVENSLDLWRSHSWICCMMLELLKHGGWNSIRSW